MEASQNNVCRVDSSPYPCLSNTTCNPSKLCIHKSHNSTVNFEQHFSLTRIGWHIPETLSLIDIRQGRTDGDLSATVNERFDRNIVTYHVDIQHCDRSKTFWIIFICHLQILSYSFLSALNELLCYNEEWSYRIISSMTICASAE
jgi:hypothetical protein